MTALFLKRSEFWGAGLLCVSLSLLLTLGFVPTADHFFRLGWGVFSPMAPPGWLTPWAFPLMAAFFFFTIPRRKLERLESVRKLAETALVPFLISLAFGWLHPAPNVFTLGNSHFLLWYLLCVPLGEELLFRGWVYEISERLWPGRWASFTNPLPVAVWVSAVCFSLWHLQNLSRDPAFFVLFQVAYTLFTGLWLGYLRWKSASLWLPIAAHVGINLASNLL